VLGSLVIGYVVITLYLVGVDFFYKVHIIHQIVSFPDKKN